MLCGFVTKPLERRASDGAAGAAEQAQQKGAEGVSRQAARLLVRDQPGHAHCAQWEGV